MVVSSRISSSFVPPGHLNLHRIANFFAEQRPPIGEVVEILPCCRVGFFAGDQV